MRLAPGAGMGRDEIEKLLASRAPGIAPACKKHGRRGLL
ncbi:hypothetical protein BN2497_3307 [Janthinobacterium sp. CG23_2]|nr:hypothetical protein BN2497_3307 [Janthinobacterium sp. CG23_2]CUU28051.1 hypothetical protein BN3177_3307 [Janthinobacterium sp. CG23_2]